MTAQLALGCASEHKPAPLVVLDSQPEVKDFHYRADTYTVRKGDTLFAIAWYANKDYRDIARYNNLTVPYSIYPGQALRLQPAKAARNAVKEDSDQSVEAGQTTQILAKRRVDQPKEQAYRKSENNVNNQPVNSVKKPPQSVKNVTKKRFPAQVTTWVWPAKGKLTGTFNRSETGQKGIEISAAIGTPILASAAGKVVYAGNGLRGYGNLIIIKHTDSFLSAYAHNDSIAVSEQQWVDAGQQIARMGKSGTDFVKLHFEVRYRGKSLDPLRYLPKRQ
ncbi:LysM peptidoglycan-binding domain-containing protein [Salinimonas sediminis]|uniref:LysM peptidoglycan-binding domain-containing protein n=2 Tax=Salinimonas sediminis TaxID=2303538 RepID=A0A346NS60_9ALTE|nr:LysM peptidoglycan-binding domain-containing protein [Salinimonas sediminis]